MLCQFCSKHNGTELGVTAECFNFVRFALSDGKPWSANFPRTQIEEGKRKGNQNVVLLCFKSHEVLNKFLIFEHLWRGLLT